jgi:hypothetical protein
MLFVALFMGLVSLAMPMMNSDIKELWFSLPNFYFLQPMPILSVVFFIMLWRDLRTEREFRPFLLTLGIFLMNYIGIGVSTWPWLVPFRSNPVGCRRRTRVPVPAADGHGVFAALRAGLHGLLFLGVPRQGLPRARCGLLTSSASGCGSPGWSSAGCSPCWCWPDLVRLMLGMGT